MGDILKGGGGGAQLDEMKKKLAGGNPDDIAKKWMKFIDASAASTDESELPEGYKLDGTIPINNIESGNASKAMKEYMEGTQVGAPTIDYTYNPWEMPEPIEEEAEGSEGGEGDNSDLLTPSGTPMPGHPDYEAWMTAGGEGLPDHADKGVQSFEDMMSDGSYMNATNLYEKLNFLPVFNMAHKMNMKQLAKEGLIDTGSVPNITNAAENAAAVAAMDKYGGFTGNFSTNSDGDSMAGGYSEGGPSAGQASGAEGYGGASYGGHGEISGFNYGGPISGSYSHGGRINTMGDNQDEDWKKGRPLAKPKPTTVEQKRTANMAMSDDRKRGALTQMLMSVGTAAATGKVANSGMVGVGYNSGSYVGNNMPGYSNDKSALYKPDIKRAKRENLRPLMASSNIWPASSSHYGGGYPIELQHPVGKGGYKEKIAMRESDAKIKREGVLASAKIRKMFTPE